MSSNVKLFSKFPNEVFIETGTWSGDGVQRAIEAGFFQIKSVESSADFYEYSKNLFLEEKKVELFFYKKLLIYTIPLIIIFLYYCLLFTNIRDCIL